MALLNLEPLSIDASPSMYTLSAGVIQGLPQVDQLHEPTSDHLADENARMNCVFTGNAAVARKVGGHAEANGDAIKDGCSRYGQNYVGGADEGVVESDGCLDHKWGIHADTFHANTRTALLNECKRQADLGNFTMVTIPSAWGSQPSQPGYNPDSPTFWTHAVIYCGYVGDLHYLMNPWGGFIMVYSSADLTLRLCFLRIYPIRAALTQGTPMAWHRQPDKSGKDDHNHTCGEGMMDKIEAEHIAANGKRNETYMHGLEPVLSFLTLEDGQILTWDGHNAGHDAMHVVEGLLSGTASRDTTISDLTTKNAKATSDLINADRTITDLKAQLAKAQTLTPKQQAAIALGQAIDAYEAAK